MHYMYIFKKLIYYFNVNCLTLSVKLSFNIKAKFMRFGLFKQIIIILQLLKVISIKDEMMIKLHHRVI